MKNIKEISTSKDRFIKLMDNTPIKNYNFELTRLKIKCDNESLKVKSRGFFSGGGMGTAVGVAATFSSIIIGIPIASPETLVTVAGSVLFGVIAGFILY